MRAAKTVNPTASKETSQKNPARANQEQSRQHHPLSLLSFLSTMSTTSTHAQLNPADNPIIQTKTICPCDGGCPVCRGALQTKPAQAQGSRARHSDQRKGRDNPEGGLQTRIQSLEGGGSPLTKDQRTYFEPRFGHDFSGVRVHTGSKGAQTAKEIQARAFTMGKHIVFAAGEYTPGTSGGKRLLAHELTHVVQQRQPVRRHPAPGRARLKPQPHIKVMKKGNTRCYIQRAVPGPCLREVSGTLNLTDIFSNNQTQTLTPASGTIGNAAACPRASSPTAPGSPYRRDDAPVGTEPGFPINAYFFPAFPTNRQQFQAAPRVLILGGVHGSERPGYQMAAAMVDELSAAQGTVATGPELAYHTVIIPCVNRAAIDDLENSRLWCNTARDYYRCNRQLVDLNRNFPIDNLGNTTTRPSDADACPNTLSAPIQPETVGVMDVISGYIRRGTQDRILSAHAIRNPASAGIFVDPNYPTSALGMSGVNLAHRLVTEGNVPTSQTRGTRPPADIFRAYCPPPGTLPTRDVATACRGRLDANGIPTEACCRRYKRSNRRLSRRCYWTRLLMEIARLSTQTNQPNFHQFVCTNGFVPIYMTDPYGTCVGGGSLGDYMCREYQGEVPVITIEAPTYSDLAQTGDRSIETYLRAIRAFITNAPAADLTQPIQR